MRRSSGRLAVAAAAALATVASLALAPTAGARTATSAPAAAAGSYVALTAPVRVLDTRTGIRGNREGAVRAGRAISVRVAGVGAVPTRGVGSVVLSLRALQPTGSGGLVAYGARRPDAATNLQFARGVSAVSNTAVVPVAGAGRITIRNQATQGRVHVAAEVVGYYRSGTASTTDHGVFHALPAARRVTVAVLPGAAVRPATVGGSGGIPADAGAIAATVTASGSTGAGTITAWRQGDTPSAVPVVLFHAREQVSGFGVLGLGGGTVVLRNTGASPVRLSLDVTGYYTEGVAATAGTMRPLPGARVLHRAVPGRNRVAVPVGGLGGVPQARVAAVVVTVQVARPVGNGALQVARYGAARPDGTAAVAFRRGASTAATLIVPVARGRFTLFNTANRTADVTVDVRGYVPADTVTPPQTFVGRYPNDLTGEVAYDSAALRKDGVADGTSGSRFVLLDLGAQSTSPPRLSAQQPGIVLALTKTRVPVPYADLVTSLTAYLQGYASAAPGVPAVIAVGTNNDGVFDPAADNYYSPADRGRDFADDLIDPLQQAAPAGITVLGANDIEAGFASDQYQALAWENAYLDATDGDLIFNGSLDGCPTAFGSSASCAYGWTQAQYVELTTNRRRVQVLPQIYIRDQSIQWANVDRTGRGSLRYAGVLTESLDPDTFTPPQGWTAFVRALAAVRPTSPPAGLRSVDIQPDTGRRR